MTESDPHAGVRTGNPRLRAPGPDGTSDGSQHTIERAHAGSPEDPLWLLAWGSLSTIAHALHDDPSIADRIRICDYISRSNQKARDFGSTNWTSPTCGGSRTV